MGLYILPNNQNFLSLSGGTVSGGTLFSNSLSAVTYYSGSTPLEQIITSIAIQNSGSSYTFSAGTNLLLLTSSTYPNIFYSLVENPSVDSILVNTLSGATLYSGSTNLYNIFSPLNSVVQTSVQSGLNTYTGGTPTTPTVNVSALTINTLTASGDTSLSNTTAQTLTVNYVDLVTGLSNPSLKKGRIFFDESKESINYYPNENPDIQIQLGRQLYSRVINNTGSLIEKGSAVKIQSSSGSTPLIAKAISSSIYSDQVIGLAAHDINNQSVGFIIKSGELGGLNLSSYTIGDIIYLSDVTAGGFVANVSSLSFIARTNQIGYVINNSYSAGTIFVNINNEDINLNITNRERNVLEGNVISTGVYEFTGITKTSNTTFNISPAKGWIVKNTYNYSTLPDVINVVYSGATNQTTPYLNSADSTYVLLTSSATISMQSTFPSPQERRQNIFLGKIVHPDRNVILNVNNTTDFDVSPMSAIRDLWTPLKLINQGINITANGSNLNINNSSGTLWGNGIGWYTNQLNPDSVTISANTPITFQYRTQLGPITGSTGPTGNTTIIDVDNYDNGGVVTAIGGGSNSSTNQRVYLFPTGLIRIQYGQHVYGTLAEAVAAVQTEQFVEYNNNRDNGILIGILSIKKGVSTLNDITHAVFNYVSKFGEALGGSAGISTTTLQQAYENSTTPEIVINSSLDGLSIKNGTGNQDASTRLLEGQNAVGIVTSYILADGGISGNSISANTIQSNSLAGSGTQMVVVDNSGVLSKQTIPSAGQSTVIRNGLNTYTAGTASDYTINVSALTINTLIVSGNSVFTGTLSGGSSFSANTLYSGSTNLNSIFSQIGHTHQFSAILNTAHTHSVSEITNLSSLLDTKLNLSGGTMTGGLTTTSLSATTISGGTLYSGSTNLNSIFVTSATTLSVGEKIFKQKNGSILEFKGIYGIGGTVVTSSANYINITSPTIPSSAYLFVAGSVPTSVIQNTLTNSASGAYAFAFGRSNSVSGYYSFAFGRSNNSLSNFTFLNGRKNYITTGSEYGIILNGNGLRIQGTNSDNYNTLINGKTNLINDGKFSQIHNGLQNNIYGFLPTNKSYYSSILNGYSNVIYNNKHSFVLSGFRNKLSNVSYATQQNYNIVLNGSGNNIKKGNFSSIHNGKNNLIISYNGGTYYNFLTILGGYQNKIQGNSKNSQILGGYNNTVTANYSVIVNGQNYSLSEDNTVLVSKLKIGNLPSAGGSYMLVASAAGNVYKTTLPSGGPGGTSTSVQPGLNTYTGGTSTNPTVNVSALTINTLTASGNSVFTGTLSGGSSFSANTLYSGTTNLNSIFSQIGHTHQFSAILNTAHTHSVSEVTNLSSLLDTKLNLSGGTMTGGLTTTSLSATTMSGGTLYSGSTNLGNLFATPSYVQSLQTTVRSGTNTYTGGTSTNPTVNVSALTINTLTASGNSIFTGTLSGGSSFSASTLYSGSTNLSNLFVITASTLNSGGAKIFYDKNGSTLRFKPIYATGSYTSVSDTGTGITISTSVPTSITPWLKGTASSSIKGRYGSTIAYGNYNLSFGKTSSSHGSYNIVLGSYGSIRGSSYWNSVISSKNSIIYESIQYSTIVGSKNSFILNGTSNSSIFSSFNSKIYSNSNYSVILNSASSNVKTGNTNVSLISTKDSNITYASNSDIINGQYNIILGRTGYFSYFSQILSGTENKIYSGTKNSTILNGKKNRINTTIGRTIKYSAIISGYQNIIQQGADYSVVVGGQFNQTSSQNSFIGGGRTNHVYNSESSSIVGGFSNTVISLIPTQRFNSILGGNVNYISNSYNSSIVGGYNHSIISSSNVIILGGYNYSVNGLTNVAILPKVQIRNATILSYPNIQHGLNIDSNGNIYKTPLSSITTNNLSAVTVSATTFYSGSTNLSSILQVKNGILLQKAGLVSGSTFAGSPLTATINFSNSFSVNNYVITITGEDARMWSIQSKTISGFTINSNSSVAISGNVFWMASENGEGYK